MGRFVYTGSMTQPSSFFPDAAGEGIVVWRVNEETGALDKVQTVVDVINPSWLAIDRMHSRLYATSELHESADGRIAAFAIDRQTGELRLVGGYASGGSAACHLASSDDGNRIAWANYGTLPLGTTDDASIVLQHPSAETKSRWAGTHPGQTPTNSGRQERRHAHCVLFDPPRSRVISSDLGLDTLFAIPVEAETFAAPDPVFSFSPGSGPRHIAANAAHTVFYVVCELTPGIDVLRVGPNGIDLVQSVSLGHRDVAQPAGLVLSPDERHLFASIRGSGEIRGFAVLPDGLLDTKARVTATARTPRDLSFGDDGSVLFVACQDAHEIRAYRHDAATGALDAETVIARTGSPTCVRVYEPNKDNQSWPT